MNFGTFILCCTLFSSIAAFTLPQDESDNLLSIFMQDVPIEICEQVKPQCKRTGGSYDITPDKEIVCLCPEGSEYQLGIGCSEGCRCKNGRCVKDNRGKTKCNCKRGYALQDEFTCEKCDCGDKGKCMFVGLSEPSGISKYLKKCLCDLGSAEKDGICVDCRCGENSKCEFEDGEKVCYCIEGYAEKDGVCTKCDCGPDGQCTFNRGQKICTCDEDYVEINGYCTHRCDTIKCHNGGQCKIDDNGMPVCECPERFKGEACEIDKCTLVTCRNGGVCRITRGEPGCTCPQGYFGKECEMDECSRTICQNGGRCYMDRGRALCQCYERYEGDRCEKDKCDTINCKNGGQCRIDKNRMPVCECHERFKGKECEIDKCTLITCRNGGACRIAGGEPRCLCPQGYFGNECEIDECSRTTCQNGGRCYMNRGKAVCQCRERYEGDRCEKDKCTTLNCKNNGRCAIRNGNAVCDCPGRFEGKDCEIDKCSYLDCQNGGQCEIRDRKAYCKCHPKYTGEKCEKAFCSLQYPCQNGGYCKEGTCVCLPGTSGEFCEVINECPNLCPQRNDINCTYDVKHQKAYCDCLDKRLGFYPDTQDCKRTCGEIGCQNGGACKQIGLSRFCDCLEGTSGDFCEVIPECKVMNCGKEASCSYNSKWKKAFCQCRDSSMVFDQATRTCKKTCQQPSDCLNGGTCVPSSIPDLKHCRCIGQTRGDFCEVIPGCINKDCGENAKCVFDVEKEIAVCKCNDDNFAYDPVDFKCKRPCRDSSDCRNGATCSGNKSDKFCRCLNGTIGDFCEEVPGCINKDCGRDAKCVYDLQRKSPSCLCSNRSLAFDEISKVCKKSCVDNSVCENGGICMPRGHNRFCHCQDGTSGDHCEEVDICNKLCGKREGVVCKYDLKQRIAECVCNDEKYQFDVVTKTCKPCDCGGKEISCKVQGGKKTCICPNGYVDKNGICKKQFCTEKKCSNGRCEVINDQEVCSCFEGYFLDGDECRRKICTKTPCLNGTCIVRNSGREECICPAGYSLRFGACIRGACSMHTCFGGQCKVVDGELMCVCPERYGLEGVGCFETVCKISRCFGGWCKVIDGEEVCTCHKGYVLVNDVCKKILCEKKNCFGGQCHIRNGVEECECPAGHSIVQDVCVRNTFKDNEVAPWNFGFNVETKDATFSLLGSMT